MTPFPHALSPDVLIKSGCKLMQRHAIQHAPVVKGGRVLSVITGRDVRAAEWVFLILKTHPVRTLCVGAHYVVDISEPLVPVLETMYAQRLGSTIVMRQGKLTGTAAATCRCHRGEYSAMRWEILSAS